VEIELKNAGSARLVCTRETNAGQSGHHGYLMDQQPVKSLSASLFELHSGCTASAAQTCGEHAHLTTIQSETQALA